MTLSKLLESELESVLDLKGEAPCRSASIVYSICTCPKPTY